LLFQLSRVEREEQLAAMASIQARLGPAKQPAARVVAASPSNDIKEPHRGVCLSGLVGASRQFQQMQLVLATTQDQRDLRETTVRKGRLGKGRAQKNPVCHKRRYR
jgi:hypothetical protein